MICLAILVTQPLSISVVVVWLSDSRTGNVYREIGRTETINDNLNPDFVKPINVPFFFEEVQNIRFDVYVVMCPMSMVYAAEHRVSGS